MLKKLTIENIITTAIIITTLLLIIAFYSFYQNHRKLQKLQEQFQDSEMKFYHDKLNMELEKVVFPDAREIFRPDVLHSHPINGLQLSVMEYLFSTFSFNAFDSDESNLNTHLKNLMLFQKKYETYLARHNMGLVLLISLCLLDLSFGLSILFLIQKAKKQKAIKNQGKAAIGPAGFFNPVLKAGVLKYFRGKIPHRIAKRHYTNLLLDIKEIGRTRKSHIKGCYKPMKTPKGDIQ